MPERITKFSDFFGVPKQRYFSSWKAFVSSPVATWLTVLALAFLVAFFSKFTFVGIPASLDEGSITSRDIKADRNYEIVDQEATEKLREAAIANILPVYDFNAGYGQVVSEKIAFAFIRAKEELIKGNSEKDIKQNFEQTLGLKISEKNFQILRENYFSENIAQEIIKLVIPALTKPIVEDKKMFNESAEQEISLRFLNIENGSEVVVKEEWLKQPFHLSGIAEIKQQISKQNISAARFKSKNLREAIKELAQNLIQPNVTSNEYDFQSRKVAAKEGVQDVILKVKSGEMIVRNGARLNATQVKILQGIRQERAGQTFPLEILGAIVFVLLSIIVVFYFAERFIIRFHPSRLDYTLMACVAILHVLVMRMGFSLAPVFHDALPFDIPVAALTYAIPLASSAMLIRMLLPSEESIVFVIVLSLLTSMFNNMDLSYLSFFILSNIAGIIVIAHTDKRSAIIRAGALTGVVNAVGILGIKFLTLAKIITAVSAPEILWFVICAFLGGIFSALLVMIFAPLVESLLGYTTDIKLLELANLNHPLLRELIVRAPGTYHHSHLVGIIAEAAAEAVGANALLVRVAAYYHDIGKIKKPLYFVENVRNGDDKHAKLSPHMSSLIISSHVTDGAEMAREAKLPRTIIDILKQHHGKRQISFFYEKAKAIKTNEIEKIDPADFEYEGPKPQSREAAILMLADVSEAAVRALKEKGVTRIQQTVDRVIQACFTENQLDECDLTLRDLNEIAKAFKHILLGIYHQRIEYQKSEDKKEEKNIGLTDTQPASEELRHNGIILENPSESEAKASTKPDQEKK
ncbi:MAG: HDIG domain-containing metalloprotein [Pseudomonadota bacterium]